MRKKPGFVPELSLVAEEEGRILGQIVLYETRIETDHDPVTALVLSPISVHPEHFRRGIATAMMEQAFAIAAEMGYPAVFLCGEPAFYQKLAIVPSHQLVVRHVADPEAAWCMARELRGGALERTSGAIDIV